MSSSPKRSLSSTLQHPNVPKDDLASPARRVVLGHGVASALLSTSVVMLLTGCNKSTTSTPKSEATATATEPATSGKVYTIGSDATNAPFESEDDKGDVIGFDADLLQAIATKAGIEVELINTPWEGLLTALEQGDLDAAISSIVVTDERRQTLAFGTPYFDAQQLIIVPTASPVRSLADLKTLRVAVQNGAAADDLLTPMFSRNPAALQRFESIPLALTELEANTVDAVVADNGVLAHYATHNGAHTYRLVNDPAFEVEQYAIAVKKGNAELLGKLNAGLSAVRADGTYAELYQRYFGARIVDKTAPAASKPTH